MRALVGRVVAVHLDRRGVLGHGQGLDPLPPVEPGEVGDEAFDDERAVRVEHARDVAETVRLPVGVGQVEQGVENQVNQPVRPLRRHVGHVADGDRDPLATRFGAQPRHHRRRGFDALDGDAPGSQG